MIKYFNDDVVLTSQNKGAFLNFSYESIDPSIYFLIPSIDTSIDNGILFINGLDINIYEPSYGYSLEINPSGDPSVASFLVYSDSNEDFSYNIKINIYDSSLLFSPLLFNYDVSILNRPFKIANDNINAFSTKNVQVDGDTSYLLMRSNPKFSGNIKLIIDSSNSLYLDTFKVSNILSNKLYRKQKVSANSVLSSDIRSVFSDLPLGEMYRIDVEDTLNIEIPNTEYKKQYDVNYSYGIRLFKDNLYPEDYAMLAPLWINNKLPDYFLIFRLSGVYNTETYDDLSLSDLATNYLKNSELTTSWSIKEDTPLGIYLRNYQKEILNNRSPIFLSLSDPAKSDYDPNTWHGVAIDKGIITGRSEIPYFFDQRSNNFTDMNAFLSEGFERNNLLCPNLVNMEFIFSDEDVSLYQMNRYFGLYVTENNLYKIAYYSSSPDPSSLISIISLDNKDSSIFFNSVIFDASGNIVESYKNRILTLDDILSVKRISNKNIADGSDWDLIEEWINKPGKNIFSTEVNKIETEAFISLKLNVILSPGEHLRVIDNTSNEIWEIMGVSSTILNAGESWTYATTSSSEGYPTLYRTCFSTQGEISDQIDAIQSAFNVFKEYEPSSPFKTGIKRNNEISLIKDASRNLSFQRLTAQTVNDTQIVDSSFNSAAGYTDINFYGRLDPSLSDFERLDADSSFGPINMEIFGDRMSITLNFIDPSAFMYSLDASNGKDFTDNILYKSLNDGWYRLIQSQDVSTTTSYSFDYVSNPISSEDKIIIFTENEISLIQENIWNAYDVYPLVISLMGINPVKDFDFTVYDSNLGYESEYWYNRYDDTSTYIKDISSGGFHLIDFRGSFELIEGDGSIYIGNDVSTYLSVSAASPFRFNTFNGEASIYATSNTKLVYNVLDGSKSYTSYKTGISEENINDYYQDPSTKKVLKYGLTVPFVTKWESLGNDVRGNPLRLILDGSIFDNDNSPYNTNFITFKDPSDYIHYDGEITYPSYKYLNSGTKAWEDYIFYDINDIIIDNSINYTIREFMFNNPTVDVFSKLIYSNKDVSGTKIRSSIVYYNNFKNTIDTIIKGLNLSMAISSEANAVININDWNKYRISFISSASRPEGLNYPIEMIVNENTKTILIIWYQGADNLNYNQRYSSVVGGKGILDNDSPVKNFRNFVDDPSYSYFKTPFYINNSSVSITISNFYDKETTYDVSSYNLYAQLNFNSTNYINSIFNAYNYNNVDALGVFSYLGQYNTFSQYVNYIYIPNSATFGDNINNYAYTYFTNYNHYANNTLNLDILQYLIGLNNISYHIIKKDIIYDNTNFSNPPITITINNPRLYKSIDSSTGIYTYNGWYRPKFNNILNFNSNETTEIINIVEEDFTLSNTSLLGYNNIPQLWYNKVVSNVTGLDVSVANAIYYKENFNPFKALWDADYFVLSEQTSLTTQIRQDINGYNSSLELPSYFGSKVIKLPNEILINNWNTTTTTSTDGRSWNTLEYNLTRAIVNKFKETSNFTNNWAGLSSKDSVIDAYIRNTIIGYYNISKPKISVNQYSKAYNGTRLALILDGTFEESSSKNIDGTLVFKNNEYIYKIKVPILPNLTYFFDFILVEK